MVGVVGLAFVVVAGLMIAVFVLTIIWQWRLAKNHQLLGRPDTAFGPGWAIGAWFIPLANFVIPILQLRDLWKGSAPGLPRGSPVWKRQSTGALLWVWWGLFVASFVIDWISSISVDEETDELAEVTGQLDRLTGVAVVAYSLRIAAAISVHPRHQAPHRPPGGRRRGSRTGRACFGADLAGRGVRVAGGQRRTGTGVVGRPGVPHRCGRHRGRAARPWRLPAT